MHVCIVSFYLHFWLHMKPFLSSFPRPLFSSFNLAFKQQTHLQSLKSFSLSTSTSKTTKWNSTANVIITHPTLLIMESCTSMIQLKQIQASMTRTGLITHTFPFSRVLAFCALAGDINHAHVLFTQIQHPNTFMWNTMIRGYSRTKMPIMGFSFFCQMVHQRVEMDNRSFVFALKACEQFSTVLDGKSVHCAIWKMGFACGLLVQNGLIHFYGVHGCLGLARQVFDGISVRDVVSWTSMIDGYSAHNYYTEALKLFDSMLVGNEVQPNEVTMIAVLSACSQKGDLRLGKRIHDYVRKRNVKRSLNLMNAMLDMYVKCGCLVAAREIFDNMRIRDVFSWTIMSNGYAKSGELELARIFFNEMPERNVISWNAMIAGYAQNGKPKEALNLFHDMVDAGFDPVENTLVCVLSACGQFGCLELGQWIHLHYIDQKRIEISVIIANALIDMYAKCGVIDAAAKVFKDMPERDLVSWNSMIAAYAAHGQAKEALFVFEQMRSGFTPDDITFVGVLSACSHGRLVNEGRQHFQNMESAYGIEPKGEHYACMVDLLGRVGLLQDAYELITKMPMEPSVAAWGALLNACRMHGNFALAKLAAHKLLDLDPEDSGIYVLLANICAHGRRWGDARMVRSMMRVKGVKKIPARSLIEVDGEFHEFLASDESHSQSKDIYKVLNEIILLSALEDFVPNTPELTNSFMFCDDLLPLPKCMDYQPKEVET